MNITAKHSVMWFQQWSYRFLAVAIALLVVGQLGRVSILPTAGLFAHDIPLAIAAVLWLIGAFKRQGIPGRAVAKAIGIFIVVAGLSVLLALPWLTLPQFVVAVLFLVRWGVYTVGFFIAAKASRSQRRILQELLLYSSVGVAVLGLIQLWLYPNLRNLYYAGYDPHLNRVFSTFLDPNFAGVYFVLGILLLFGRRRLDKQKTLVHMTALGILISALLLTYSRSAYLALLVGGFVYTVRGAKLRLFVGIVVAFLTVVVLLPRPPGGEGVRLERSATIAARIQNWQEAAEVFAKNPALGVGFNAYRYRRVDQGATGAIPSLSAAGVDNSFLFVLATTGVVGLASYLYMWSVLLRQSGGEDKYRQTLRLSSTAAVFVHALFVNTLFYPWVMLWLWVVLGTTVDTKQSAR